MVLRVGLVGHGAIGATVAQALRNSTHGLERARVSLVAVLTKTAKTEVERGAIVGDGDVYFTTDINAFLTTDFDVCVECAGQEAVRALAVPCLESGRRFLCTSIGAMTDDALMDRVVAAARLGNTQFQLASGAMPGIDWMSSSALEPGSRVTAVQTKPPESWVGARFKPGTTDALPDVIDFELLTERTVFFQGSARDAAAYYPKNSNVLAMLALSTAGLDNVECKLVADPIDRSMRQFISYEGSAGKITLDVCGKKSSTNPRTSQVVPLSVIKALRNMSSPLAIGL